MLRPTLALALAAAGVARLGAQDSRPWVRLGGQAIPIVSRSDAVPGGSPRTEARLVQPVLMLTAGALGDRVRLEAMADLERWTMPNGELTPGAYGEGFYDRRHPHTVAHEVMVVLPDVARDLRLPVALSLAAGKGFAPFGTDDPMSRPPILYPVNHHLSQVLERAVGVLALRAGRAGVEVGLFNGDEPEYPTQWPKWSRIGDSWSARLTLFPVDGLEWQASRAHVHSPEHRLGAGTDAEKWSTSLRWERRSWYGLTEWARTSEAAGAYVFHSFLAEGAWRRARHHPYLRLERTERPEEIREAGDEFRSVRPHTDNSIVGITRWTIATGGYGYAVPAAAGRLTVQPTVEVALARVARIGGGLFDPAVFYGRTTFSSLSFGVRMEWGMAGHRMGRYGATGMSPGMTMPGMDHH
jgi:hypothetical protein